VSSREGMVQQNYALNWRATTSFNFHVVGWRRNCVFTPKMNPLRLTLVLKGLKKLYTIVRIINVQIIVIEIIFKFYLFAMNSSRTLTT
jgi:hypothetical protein